MKRVIVFLVIVLGSLFVGAVDVNAASDTPSWIQSGATVTQDIPTVANVTGECAGTIENRFVSELNATYRICLFGTSQLRFGYFSAGGPYVGAVQFPLSTDVHVLEGVCSGFTCRYSAERDMLVTQRPVSQGYPGFVVYLHASERIKKEQLPGGGFKYVFRADNPDYSIKNSEGQYIVTPTFATSKNGEWIVVELRNAGFALISTKSFSVRQISTEGSMYGYGMDPSLQLAVSNDGNKVAVTGQNAGFRIIERVVGCGQDLAGNLSKIAGSMACPSSDLGIGTRFPNFHSVEQPTFRGDGYQFEAVVNSWVDGSRQVTFLAAGAVAAPKLKLLAFGDSFTSGEGEMSESFYKAGTNSGFDRCHVSERSYPLLVASMLLLDTSDAKTVACAGATTGDIAGVANEYRGQGGRLGENGLKLSDNERYLAQEEALRTFQPGRALQSSFLERYSAEKLLIGIGGNDAGLMGKLRACVMPDTCEWVAGEGLRSSAAEIKRLFQVLGSLFSSISGQSPGTKVFVVGYPNIINPSGVCDPVTNILLNQTERTYISESISYMNRVIRAAAKQAEFTFVDVENSMNGRRLCDGSSAPAMNGLRLGDDISVSSSFPMLKLVGSETFHPTPIGHQLVAETILLDYPGLVAEAGCATDPMACIPATPDIEPSSYWGIHGEQSTDTFAVHDLVRNVSDTRRLRVEVPAGMLEPGTDARIEVRSEIVALKTVTTQPDGSFVVDVTLPDVIEDGFHTIHVVGKSREGREVDLYQGITVGVWSGLQEKSEENGVSSVRTGKVANLPSTPTSQYSQAITAPFEVSSVLGVATTKGTSGQLAPHDTNEESIHEIEKSDDRWWLFYVIGFAVITLLGIMALWHHYEKS